MRRLFICVLAMAFLPAAVHADCSPGAKRPPAINTPDYVYLVPDSNMAPIGRQEDIRRPGPGGGFPRTPTPTVVPLRGAYFRECS